MTCFHAFAVQLQHGNWKAGISLSFKKVVLVMSGLKIIKKN